MDSNRTYNSLFTLGDHAAGAAVGAATAAAVRGVVCHDTDMVVAMLLGMAIGMLVHLVVGVAVSPLLGAFHVMVPGSLIGMYGGMLFAMRDTMQHAGSTSNAILVGVAFGVVVTAGVQLYDRALRAPVSSAHS